jgi:hypothetical protein
VNIRMSAILGPFLETIVSCFPIPMQSCQVETIENLEVAGAFSL